MDVLRKIFCSLLLLMTQPLRLLGNNSDPWSQNYRPLVAAEDGPVFDNSLVTNVTAQLGGTAHLQCKVLNIKQNDNPVSWIRRRDWHILSAGNTAFTQDARFHLIHKPGNSDWTLAIKYLQSRDEGTYVCQVSTLTGVKSHYFNLHVMVPTAFILGSDEYHTQAGNAISLVCIIENSLDPPQYVFWYHNEKLINYERVSRVSVQTDPGPKTHSRLIISNVIREDSGNYTCSAPNTVSSSIDVFVSPGDKTLSLSDHSGCVFGAKVSVTLQLFLFVLVVFVTNLHKSWSLDSHQR